MELLVLVVALVMLALLALRFGHDSRPGFTTHEAIARDGLVTTDLTPEAAGSVEPQTTTPAHRRHRPRFHVPRIAHP